ncbi:type I asparaginase [Emticicia sp. CRIBPO]|uniref:asparaginase n=1 Tax=Emticicia sp. CRIBPO TaxID=2683258 RepID=UPI001412B5AF|nr:asparaginase [Emticicia sp. CRIBPO]NBA85629.1 type I asparaginase [Emticicia sp. CRIBPO]
MINYQINTFNINQNSKKILLIYTGGTFGMVYDNTVKSLVPFNFNQILNNLPEIQRLDFELSILALPEPIDSSNVSTEIWLELAAIIRDRYDLFDGFVILHGTDTMAYSASALSFLLENLSKPVIFTGAQLPIGLARTDARENLITALEIASSSIDGRTIVPEVSIYFNGRLIRGNRAKKQESSQFDAFNSENYPFLADVGVTIDFKFPYIRPYLPDLPLKVHEQMNPHVAILKIFPGMSAEVVSHFFKLSHLKGVVMETFGAGNAPSKPWFLDELRKATEQGIVIMNVSQCTGGRVIQGKYETSRGLQEIGVISGKDITTEAAITKMMFLLGTEPDIEKVKILLETPLAGEMDLI